MPPEHGSPRKPEPRSSAEAYLEIEAQAEAGFNEPDVGVVRDNARQLRFKADSTGFDD
jgi:uncharacterized protein